MSDVPGTTTGEGMDMKVGALMAGEIAEQPATLARLLDQAPGIARVATAIARRKPRFVLFAARGTSDHAALYAKYLVEIRLGLPAGLVSPSTMTLYASRPNLTDVLFIAVSQSGGSPDIAESMTAARKCGATTVAVVNAEGSPLAEIAEFTIHLGAGPERAVAATKTYTAELLALYLLLGGDPATTVGLPEAAARTLERAPAAHAAAGRFRFADRLVTTGRGYSYPTACEGALKLMETCYLATHAFSSADLLHGPVAMLDSAVPVIAVVSAGPGGDAAAPVVDRLRAAGVEVLEIGGTAGTDGLPVDAADIAQELLPVLEIVPLQQLAWRLAVDRGIDPDRPRGLAKITKTR